jgi:hypothetical protein
MHLGRVGLAGLVGNVAVSRKKAHKDKKPSVAARESGGRGGPFIRILLMKRF